MHSCAQDDNDEDVDDNDDEDEDDDEDIDGYVIAMTTNNDYWKLRIQHHMRKRIRKCTAVHRVVMMAMIDMMMIVLPINDKRRGQ